MTLTKKQEIALKKIGKRLKALRISKNVTQEALAAEAQVSLKSLKNLEAGDPVSITTFIKVIGYFKLLDPLVDIFPKDTQHRKRSS